MTVLIVSPVRQTRRRLREFLESLEKLDTAGLDVSFAFIDDNDDDVSRVMLKIFQRRQFAHRVCPVVSIIPGWIKTDYICDETGHKWTGPQFEKMAAYRDRLLDRARKYYDYVFMVDSDLVLQPPVLKHLISLNRDIVAEVFWTRWNPAPQRKFWANVWGVNPYHTDQELYDEIYRATGPGTYKVGGLGACTLISRKALDAGASYLLLPNVDYLGEDRHFCVRAAALGLELWADTHYPPYHIYRDSEFAGLPAWKDRQRERGSRITVGMLVRNEGDRYLRQVLEQVKEFADSIVILDDASDDDIEMGGQSRTVAVCCEELGMLNAPWWEPVREPVSRPVANGTYLIYPNQEYGFGNEIALRKQLWDLCVEIGSDWIMILDADEVFESRAIEELPRLAANRDAEVYCFRKYDMWSPTHYRSDNLWVCHTHYDPYMVRYIPGYDYQWYDAPLHCGRYPYNITEQNIAVSDLRLKHLGWSRPADQQRKYDWYKKMDPEGKWGNMEQYLSILDEDPHLVEWHEPEKKPTISLCMIVKDEEKNLRRCLESVKDAVDEIVIVDTGSTDETLAIAVDFGVDRIMLHAWNNDFSEARNVALEHATGDWILSLDADEELLPKSRDMLRSLVASDQVEGYFCTVTNQLIGEQNQDVIFRLFRNRPEYRFEGAIHEQITESIAKANPGRVCFGPALDFEILHHGYTADQIAVKDKASRNLKIFENVQIADNDLLLHYHKGVELMRAEQWDDAIGEFIAATRGINTRQIYFPKLLRFLVMALFNYGRYDNSLDLAILGTKLLPDYADLYYFAGSACYAKGSYSRAASYLKKAMVCPEQPVNYSSFAGVRDDKSKEIIDTIQGARENAGMAGLDDCNLLPLYLSAYQAEGTVDIVAGEQVFKDITIEKLRREIEWRELMPGE